MNKKEYKLAVFDLDGTLLDTRSGILRALEYTIAQNGLPALSKEKLLTFVGPQIFNSFRDVFQLSDSEADRIASQFREVYAEDCFLLDAQPYDGIFEVLDKLRRAGIRMGVATYKRHDCMLPLLSHFGFAQYMQGLMFGSDVEHKLTKKDIIELCVREANIEAGDCVMIGDSLSDGNEAYKLGVDFIGVEYGYGIHCEEDTFKCPGAIGSVKNSYGLLNIIK